MRKRAMAATPGLQLDGLFAALADPTRRAIVERLLAKGELSVGHVARPVAISTPAISRYLQVLEWAGWSERPIEHRWRSVRVRASALTPVESWLSRQRRHWTAALDCFESLAAAQTPKRK